MNYIDRHWVYYISIIESSSFDSKVLSFLSAHGTFEDQRPETWRPQEGRPIWGWDQFYEPSSYKTDSIEAHGWGSGIGTGNHYPHKVRGNMREWIEKGSVLMYV